MTYREFVDQPKDSWPIKKNMLHGVYAFWRYQVAELSKDEYWFWSNIFCKSLQMYLRNWGHSHLWYTVLIFRVNSTKHQLLWLNVIKSTWVVTHIFELTQLFSSEDFLTYKLYTPPPPLTHTRLHKTCMRRVESWFKISWYKILLDFRLERTACVTKGINHHH